jgi:hypothetical protein
MVGFQTGWTTNVFKALTFVKRKVLTSKLSALLSWMRRAMTIETPGSVILILGLTRYIKVLMK